MRYIKELPLDKYPMKTMVINADEFSNNLAVDLNNRGDVNKSYSIFIFINEKRTRRIL